MASLDEGRSLGDRFTLVSRLGVGFTAETWLARDSRADAPLALKIVTPETLALPDVRDWLEHELPRRSVFAHPAVIAPGKLVYADGCALLPCPYFAGDDFGRFRGRPIAELLAALDPLLDALDKAHAAGIVHGGIKASNLLCDAAGRPFLFDLATAGLVFRAPTLFEAALRQPAAAAFSPALAAGRPPEPADDVYALGALLYEAISGRPAHSGAPPPTLQTSGSRILAPLQSAERRGAGGEGLVEGTVARALADRTEDRIQSVAALRAELDRSRGSAAAGDAVAATSAVAPSSAATPTNSAAPSSAAAPTSAAAPSDAAAVAAPGAPAPTDPVPHAAPIGAAGHSGATDSVRPLDRQGRALGRPLVIGGLALMLLLAIGVFFVLPRVVVRAPNSTTERAAAISDEQRPGKDPAQAPTGAASPGIAALAAALRDAEALLERAEVEAAEIGERGVTIWAGTRYAEANAHLDEGRQRLAARDYTGALRELEAAQQLFAALTLRADAIYSEAALAGATALEAGLGGEARERYARALLVRPHDRAAQRGAARAATLDEVFALLQTGGEYELRNELALAQQAYRNATVLDPAHPHPRTALQRVEARIARASFQRAMSQGYTSLDRGEFVAALQGFAAAQRLQPGSRGPRDGIAQTEEAQRTAQIAARRNAARALEDEERWEEAAGEYAAALGIDPEIRFAQEGERYARARVDLSKRLEDYRREPAQLQSQGTWQTAVADLEAAERIAQRGPVLQDQIDTVTELVRAAGSTVLVEILSDGLTDVVLYHVGQLGPFAQHEVRLHPGTYTIVGTRDGFRDVRRRFTVVAGQAPPPVRIACEEEI